MRKLLLVLAFLLLTAGMAHAESRSHVVLIDQSGSMVESNYYGEGGPLQQFLTDLLAVRTAFQDKDSVQVGLFSASGNGFTSPDWITTTTGAKLRSQFDATVKPRLKGIPNYTNMVETLQAAQKELAKTDQPVKVIWLLTDNVEYAPGDQEGNTERFYAELGSKADISRIYLVPVLLRPADKQGLVLYVMLQGGAGNPEVAAEADRMMEALGGTPVVRKWGQTPILAKPLGQNVLSIHVVSLTPAEGVQATMEQDPQTGAIKLKGYREGDRLAGSLEVKLVSRYATLKIEDAQLEVQMPALRAADFTVQEIRRPKIAPTRLQNLAAGQQTSITYRIDFDVPGVESRFNLKSLSKWAGSVEGEIRLIVKNPVLSMDIPKGDERFYKVNLIPGYLAQEMKVMRSEHPVEIMVKFPTSRIIITSVVLLLVFLLVAGLIWYVVGHKEHYHLEGAGLDEYMTFGVFGGRYETSLGTVHAGFGGAKSFRPVGGGRVPLRSGEFEYQQDGQTVILTLTRVSRRASDLEGGYVDAD